MPIAKNIILTGASKGLGEFTALKLAEQKDVASLTLIARTQEKLQEIKRKIPPHIRVEIIPGDLSTSEGMDKIIASLRQTAIACNVLINNAAYGHIGKLENTSDTEIDKVFFTNLIAPLRLIKYFLPIAREQKWGRIINISSISIFHPNPEILPYILSKSPFLPLAQCLTLSDMSNGITCNTILPGMMLSEMGKMVIRRTFPDYSTETAAKIEKKISDRFPAKKMTDFEEITNTMEFLISEKGASISGEFFRIASGLL